MADGFGCRYCGHQEAEHDIVEKMRLGLPEFLEGKPPFTKKEIERQVKGEYPGVCRNYTQTKAEIKYQEEEY